MRAPTTRSIGFQGLFTHRSSTWPAWSCPGPGKLNAPASSSPSSYGRGISMGGSRNGSTLSRPSSATMRRSGSVSHQRGFWSTRSRKDGDHCATSLVWRCQTDHFRTSTTPKPFGDGSDAYAYSPPLRLPSVCCWQAWLYCTSAVADDTDPLGALFTQRRGSGILRSSSKQNVLTRLSQLLLCALGK